ncbi:MAG: MarR family winged helix-turn-helix transcriptional regulator [Treponema sp.]|nr:MarR family winged helix-turn-helix transcriptional regulator [Treponema sp.]
MEYTLSSVMALISHIHTNAADFTNKRLSEKCNLVSSHGHILFLLSKNKAMSMRDISDAINRNKSTTTVLIRKLKEEGLIKEENSKEDARSKHISLTAKGKKYNELTSCISEDLISVCYKNFSESEKKALLELLVKLNDNIENSLI